MRPLLQRISAMISAYARLIEPTHVGGLKISCSLCEFPFLVVLARGEMGIRCPRCRASVVHMSMAHVLNAHCDSLSKFAVYELSSRGPFVTYLRRSCMNLKVSEFWPDLSPGQWRNGIQCQNVERLTYADESFDLCTSTEVFEHVVDDLIGFREIRRVLRSGGVFIFSVPLRLDERTLERAALIDGEICYLEEPEYHDDLLRGAGKVLAYRTYGFDITDKLLEAGFSKAIIDTSATEYFNGLGRPLIVATV
ncbi:MAG: methyltransferase domain-containing protein [Halieaceae bacterium]|nr:methyltransferase domain-containing protein [Halieaceae bacterium]